MRGDGDVVLECVCVLEGSGSSLFLGGGGCLFFAFGFYI